MSGFLRWIPVAELLPDFGEDVLVYFRPVDDDGRPSCGGCDAYGGLIDIAWLDVVDGERHWIGNCDGIRPIYWMPLPTPPNHGANQ